MKAEFISTAVRTLNLEFCYRVNEVSRFCPTLIVYINSWSKISSDGVSERLGAASDRMQRLHGNCSVRLRATLSSLQGNDACRQIKTFLYFLRSVYFSCSLFGVATSKAYLLIYSSRKTWHRDGIVVGTQTSALLTQNFTFGAVLVILITGVSCVW